MNVDANIVACDDVNLLGSKMIGGAWQHLYNVFNDVYIHTWDDPFIQIIYQHTSKPEDGDEFAGVST